MDNGILNWCLALVQYWDSAHTKIKYWKTVVLYRKYPHHFILDLFRVLPQWFICTVAPLYHCLRLMSISGTQLLPNIEHSLNIKITPNQRPFWRSSGCISMKTFVFEDSRLLLLWRIRSWMLSLKSLLIRNSVFINQRNEEFSLAVIFYIDSRNKLFLQPPLEEKIKKKWVKVCFICSNRWLLIMVISLQFFLNIFYSSLDILQLG